MNLYFFTLTILLTCLSPIDGHPQCLDFGPPFEFNGNNMFCTIYNEFGCCTIAMDNATRQSIENIESELNSKGLSMCVPLLKEVACQECSPYAAHVFDTEGGGQKKLLPGLCRSFCSKLYQECKDAIPIYTQNQQVLDALSSEDDFCRLTAIADNIYCYPDILDNTDLENELNRTTSSVDGCICLQEIATNLKNPLLLISSDNPDHCDINYVLTQEGIIYVYEDGVKLEEPFLDIREQVEVTPRRGDERGLLGLAFHTNFKKSETFYVYFISSEGTGRGGFSRLSEFKIFPGNVRKANPKSERVILDVNQRWRNHNGGMLIYGQDGYLYVFLGDGGSGRDPLGNGQNLDTLHGSILRLDVDKFDARNPYSIPPDNPFVNTPGRDEIFAYGLRNPYRGSEDRGDPETGEGAGRIFAGDVGQSAYEEVDHIKKGLNYGWSKMEGPYCMQDSCDAFEPPIVSYGRDLGRSVIAGYVYRGCLSPNFNGLYFYADYTGGIIYRLNENPLGSNKWDNKAVDVCGTDLCFNGLINEYGNRVLSFGEDYNGEVYMLTSNSASSADSSGKIYRLVDPRRRGDPDKCKCTAGIPSISKPSTNNPVVTTTPKRTKLPKRPKRPKRPKKRRTTTPRPVTTTQKADSEEEL